MTTTTDNRPAAGGPQRTEPEIRIAQRLGEPAATRLFSLLDQAIERALDRAEDRGQLAAPIAGLVPHG